MHKIKEKLMDALYEYEDIAAKNATGKLSDAEIERIHKLTDTIKNIDKIEMLEEDGYSKDGHYMGEGRIYGTSYDGGNSYRRGRGRNAKRDLMGRYANAGGYSRDGTKDYMLEQLEEMMENAHSDKERKAIEHCIKQIEEA